MRRFLPADSWCHPSAVPGDVTALHLDHADADTGPRDEEVQLLLALALDQADRVEEHCLVRELIA